MVLFHTLHTFVCHCRVVCGHSRTRRVSMTGRSSLFPLYTLTLGIYRLWKRRCNPPKSLSIRQTQCFRKHRLFVTKVEISDKYSIKMLIDNYTDKNWISDSQSILFCLLVRPSMCAFCGNWGRARRIQSENWICKIHY